MIKKIINQQGKKEILTKNLKIIKIQEWKNI